MRVPDRQKQRREYLKKKAEAFITSLPVAAYSDVQP